MAAKDYQEIADKRSHTMKDKDILKRLLKYAVPFKYKFILAIIIMAVTASLTILQPYLIGISLDNIVYDLDLPILFQLLGLLVVVIIANNLLSYIQTMILQRAGQSIIYNIRKEIFTHLENHDTAYLNKKPTGTLVTRVTNDTNTLSEMYTTVIVNVFSNILKIVGIVVFMFIFNPTLTLYIIIIIPLIIIFAYIFRKFARKAYRQQRANLSKVNAFLAEHLSGMKIIQIFNKEKQKLNQFDKLNTKLKYSYYRQILIFGIYRPTMYLLKMVSILVVYYVGGLQVIEGVILIGTLFTFHQLIGHLFEPIQQLADMFNSLQSAFAASERLFGILDTLPKIVDEENAIDLTDVLGSIEFKHVWFAYSKNDWILKDVSFTVNPNDSVAFVGATGAGKTTIIRLITRTYDIQKGQILIDGKDIHKISKASLRKSVGQMLQDVFLFSGTIKSNITLRNEAISDEQIKEACDYVNASDFINKLPHKLDEVVRERGNNFSSGQRQLLSFARTIVHEPKIMMLDEATSNIDTETEQLIQDSLHKMMSIGTMLIVAHRLSTIQHVDKIIVLSNGEIIEQGNHQELLRNKGHYYNLYKLQYQD